MLSKGRTPLKAPEVIWAVGDGSSTLREPLNQNWIQSTAVIMEVLEGRRQGFPMETFKALANNMVFEKFDDDAEPVNTSLGLAMQFHSIIKDIFKCKEIKVSGDAFQTMTSCPWASVIFQGPTRRCGLHFVQKEPFFEVFLEPTEYQGEKKKQKYIPEPEPQKAKHAGPRIYTDDMGNGHAVVAKALPSESAFNSKFARSFT
jgi:hypothetical protein